MAALFGPRRTMLHVATTPAECPTVGIRGLCASMTVGTLFAQPVSRAEPKGAHETTPAVEGSTDAYVIVAAAVPAANVHLNADAP
jgi:hypothetical protein